MTPGHALRRETGGLTGRIADLVGDERHRGAFALIVAAALVAVGTLAAVLLLMEPAAFNAGPSTPPAAPQHPAATSPTDQPTAIGPTPSDTFTFQPVATAATPMPLPPGADSAPAPAPPPAANPPPGHRPPPSNSSSPAPSSSSPGILPPLPLP